MPFVVVAAVLLALNGSPGAENPLVGTWEGSMTFTSGGETVEIGTCHVIYAADGHSSRLCVPASRPKLTKKPNEMSAEDWSALL